MNKLIKQILGKYDPEDFDELLDQYASAVQERLPFTTQWIIDYRYIFRLRANIEEKIRNMKLEPKTKDYLSKLDKNMQATIFRNVERQSRLSLEMLFTNPLERDALVKRVPWLKVD